MEFPDGSSPPKAVIKQWLKIVYDHFGPPDGKSLISKKSITNPQKSDIDRKYSGLPTTPESSHNIKKNSGGNVTGNILVDESAN